MGKYHKQKSQYIYRQKGKLWHLLYSINTQTANLSLPVDRTTRSPAFWTPPTPTWPSLIKLPLMHSYHSY